MVRLNKCSSLVKCVDFSDLSGATVAVYKFFRINNVDLKCSFVRCRKCHKSWWNGAAELHISVNLLCGTTAAELHNSVDLLCSTTAAELRNSVDLLCGTTAAETFERWTFWKIQQTHIDSIPWNMYALRRFSKLHGRIHDFFKEGVVSMRV